MRRWPGFRSGVITALAVAALAQGGAALAGDLVATVQAGGYHTCALRNDATVWCWGDNDDGKLGQVSLDPFHSTPGQVRTSNGLLKNVVSLSTTAYHTCAARANGSVLCWGEGANGKLGNGSTDGSSVAIAVPGLTNVKSVAAGLDATCALKTGGTVWCWGGDADEALGNGPGGDSLVPVQVLRKASTPLTGVKAISMENRTGCALLNDTTVRCWGGNAAKQLGNGGTSASGFAVQVKLGSGALTGVKQVDVGIEHVCAVMTNGEARCWGRNEQGQAGIGTTDSPLASPTRVKRGSGVLKGVTAIAAGDGATCAVATGDHLAYCWGGDADGQVGDGTIGTDRLKPAKVIRSPGTFIPATRVSVGGGHACALRTDTALFCWGYNDFGQVGDGTDGGDHYPAKRVLFPV